MARHAAQFRPSCPTDATETKSRPKGGLVNSNLMIVQDSGSDHEMLALTCVTHLLVGITAGILVPIILSYACKLIGFRMAFTFPKARRQEPVAQQI